MGINMVLPKICGKQQWHYEACSKSCMGTSVVCSNQWQAAFPSCNSSKSHMGISVVCSKSVASSIGIM